MYPAAAACVPGEQLVQPSHAQKISGDMVILIVLFGCWDKWLILYHFPCRFSFLSVLTILRITKLKLNLNAISLESQVCIVLIAN